MHILVVEDDEADAYAIRRELEGDYDITVVKYLQEAVMHLTKSGPDPQVIITDLSLPDSKGIDTVQALQQVVDNIPIIISTGILTDQLRSQIQAIGPTKLHNKNDGYSLLKTFLQHERTVYQRLDNTHKQIMSEMDRVASWAAEKVVEQSINELLCRLDLQDGEAIRTAIRLGRAWEIAKSRFFIAVTNGLAAAFLIAIGAGIIALIKHNGIR